MASHFPEIRPESREALIQRYIERNTIDPALFEQYGVKRGLRNSDGTGVVVGITKISNVHGYLVSEGDKYPIEGELTYRGYNIKDLVREIEEADRFGFEEICYLLLVGKRPSEKGLELFRESIGISRDLPEHFIGDYIMKPPTRNIMNLLERSIANLYSYDDDPESKSEDGVKPEDYEVQGMIDPQKLDEYDLNYKIYNKDIYGVDFKHGKRKKRKDG